MDIDRAIKVAKEASDTPEMERTSEQAALVVLVERMRSMASEIRRLEDEVDDLESELDEYPE